MDNYQTFNKPRLSANNDLVVYYDARAAEYEKIYDNPERQHDLTRLTAVLQDFFRGNDLLELACGTGYWTQRLALTARSVLATDINSSVLDIARAKSYPNDNVWFRQDDLYQSSIGKTFDGLFGGYIWSHIPLEQLDSFTSRVAQWVAPGGIVAFTDNLFVPGSSTPISHTDAHGNSYQTRQLADGSEHIVLKNFPAPALALEKMARQGIVCEWHPFSYYWLLIGKKTGY